MPQHDHHCLISMNGENWRISSTIPNLLILVNARGDVAVVDTSSVDWEAYSKAAVAMDYAHASPPPKSDIENFPSRRLQ